MKRVIVLALAALIALGLCACGEKDADFTPRLDTQQTATLRICGFMGNFEALDQAINAFNRLYPNVTFFYDHNTIYRLSAYLDNNANTDIFMADNQNITRPDLPDQYVLDWCLDLSQEDMDLSAVQPDALKGGTVDGQLVVLPLAMNPCGIVVNKTLLKNEGLTVPENYSQLLATLEALKAKGYTPLQGSEQHLYGELMLSMAMNLLAQEPQRIDALLSGDAEAAEAVLPAFRRLDAIVALGVVGYHAAGERGAGGGQGPGLHPDGLPPHGHAGDLHPMPGDRPEQLAAGQGIVIHLHQLTVPPAHFLGNVEQHRGLHPPIAVHKRIADGKILNINRFHKTRLPCMKI